MQNHTPGPWQWSFSGGSFYLRTVGRGLLTVMDFVRMGLQRAQPRFARWEGDERGRLGGIMFKADELGELHDHPDARLIAFAPDLLETLKIMVEVSPCQNGCRLDDMSCATRRAERLIRNVRGIQEPAETA